MVVKHCVGAVIYDGQGRVFLMTSDKWPGYWLVPGGRIESGETPEQALHREITREETGIGLADVVFAGRTIKPPSPDFHNPTIEFHFESFYARALNTDVKPNEEIKSWGWFHIEEALQLNLLDTTRSLLEKYKH